MQSITFYLILLFCYATLALIFISFNAVYPKRYISLLSLSHVLGILTVVSTIFREIYNRGNLISSVSALFFLLSNFLVYAAINNFLKIKLTIYHIYAAIVLVIFDLSALNYAYPMSVFTHKIFLMSIYAYLGIRTLNLKNKTFAIYFSGISIIIFALIQMFFGFSWLFIERKDYFIDIVAYVLQTLTYSLSIILITIEEVRSDFTSEVSKLQKKVEHNEKRLQEAYELDKLKTEFIANISHELRTPVNIIFSTIQLLEINIPKECEESNLKIKLYLKSMKQNCFRQIKLVNNLIDMSKIEAGFVQLNLHNYDIVKLVEDITLSIVPYAEKKNIEVEFDTEFEEKFIACDSEKIERAVLNLLSNAVKFTGENGKIEVYVKEEDKQICISIKDNGIGIPNKMQQAIYNRFTQVEDTFVRKNEGSGIGLSLVKSLIEMHEGKIILESELNKGSKFTITLPLKVLDNDQLNNLNLDGIGMKKVEIEFSDVNI